MLIRRKQTHPSPLFPLLLYVDHKPESTNSPIHLSFLNLSKSLSKLSTLVAIALSWGYKVQRLLMGYVNNILNQVYQMALISLFWESKTHLSPPHTHLNHFLFSASDNERLYRVSWTACLESVKWATRFEMGPISRNLSLERAAYP